MEILLVVSLESSSVQKSKCYLGPFLKHWCWKRCQGDVGELALLLQRLRILQGDVGDWK